LPNLIMNYFRQNNVQRAHLKRMMLLVLVGFIALC